MPIVKRCKQQEKNKNPFTSKEPREATLNKLYLIGWEPNISPQRSNAKIALSACRFFKYEFVGTLLPTIREIVLVNYIQDSLPVLLFTLYILTGQLKFFLRKRKCSLKPNSRQCPIRRQVKGNKEITSTLKAHRVDGDMTLKNRMQEFFFKKKEIHRQKRDTERQREIYLGWTSVCSAIERKQSHKTTTFLQVKCMFKHNFRFQIPFFQLQLKMLLFLKLSSNSCPNAY